LLRSRPAGDRRDCDSGHERNWIGESESIVLGRGNQHHRQGGRGPRPPRLSSVKFTMVIDKQDGAGSPAVFLGRGTEPSLL